MDLERHLSNPIPLAEGADFFIRVRAMDKTAEVRNFVQALEELPEEEREELLKAASPLLAGPPSKTANGMMPAALPATAKGQNMAPMPATSLPPAATGQVMKAAAAFKLALEGMGLGQQQPMAQEPAGVEPTLDPSIQAYLQAEEQGSVAAAEAALDQLRGKLQEAMAAQQVSEERASQLEQAQAMHEQQIAEVQQQVTQSSQQAVESQDKLLAEQQASAAMRMAYQQLRGQVLQVVSADPPAIGADEAALAAASTAAGPSSTPAPQTGPAGQAPNPGTPGTAAPEGDDQVSRPITPNQPTLGNAEPNTTVGQKEPQGDAKTPSKEVLASIRPNWTKAAALKDALMQHAGKAMDAVKGALPHAAAGALGGAGLGLLEAKTSNEPLKGRIAALEAKPDRSFGDTANLAQLRGRHTIGEFAADHPLAMAGAGAIGGAALGATEGPPTLAALKQLRGHAGAIGQNLKTLFSK